jgi:hypothetical protein
MNAPDRLPGADDLVVGKRRFRSRLLVGTGKYKDFGQTREAIVASGAEIVTVAIRRTSVSAAFRVSRTLGNSVCGSPSTSSFTSVCPSSSSRARRRVRTASSAV